MLKEYKRVRQIDGQRRRRWFSDEYFDLIVWFEPDGRPSGFQLCYDKKGDYRALTWNEGKGYSHNLIDEGEGDFGTAKRSPILLADGAFAAEDIAGAFLAAAGGLEAALVALIREKLAAYKPKK